jgi:hypothetical protein
MLQETQRNYELRGDVGAYILRIRVEMALHKQ